MIDELIALLRALARDQLSQREMEDLRQKLFVLMSQGREAIDSLNNAGVITGLNADLLDGQHGSYYRNASNINAGTLSPDRFSAYSDLIAENRIGMGAGKVAPGSHTHDDSGSDVCFWVDGSLSAQTGVAYRVVPHDAVISAVYLFCKSPGTSGSTIVDIHKNGTTIFTNQSNRPTLPYNDSDGVASATPDVTIVNAGDVLQLDIDSAAVGAEGLNVVIDISSSIGGSSANNGFDVGIDEPINWPISQHNEEFDRPLSNEWIAVNMGSNWYGVSKSALIAKVVGNSTTQMRGIFKPILSGIWSCYAKIGMSAPTRGTTNSWTSCGIGLFDQSNSRLAVLINHRAFTDNEINLNLELWNTPTSYNSSPMFHLRMHYFHPYLMIAKKSGGWDFGFSYDGIDFCVPLNNYDLASFMNPTHIGFIVCNTVPPHTSVHTMHWMRFEVL